MQEIHFFSAEQSDNDDGKRQISSINIRCSSNAKNKNIYILYKISPIIYVKRRAFGNVFWSRKKNISI